MTREEAIRCLNVHSSTNGSGLCTDEQHYKAKQLAIKALEQEQKWIPVSERLPEDRREVLVTAYWHETYQVMMASYYGDGLWWCVPFNNCGEHTQRLNPKAWMPLPKPYKPQESDDKCKNCKYYLNPDYTRCHECKAESEELSCCTKK